MRAPVVAGLALVAGCAAGGPAVPREALVVLACPPRPNCVSSDAVDPDHHVETLSVDGDPAAALACVRRLLAETPRTTVETISPTQVHAVAVSRLFRFADDVDVLLDAAGRRLRIRSASRLGYGDLGVNRARIEELRRRYDATCRPVS